jgi:cyanate permease
MTSYFIGGALGSYIAIHLYNAGGWSWSITFMAVLAVFAIINVATTNINRK